MSLQSVLIPARRFDVEVMLGPHDGLGIVEQNILRAIALGAGSVELVGNVLKLPAPLVLDAAMDLLSRGLVEQRDGGSLEIGASVREAMGDPDAPKADWFLSFGSARMHDPHPIGLVQDLVAGEVFALPFIPVDRPGLPVMPRSDDVPPLREIPLATLSRAAISAIRAHRRRRSAREDELRDAPLPRDSRVLDVRLARTASAGAGTGGEVEMRARWIPALVRVTNRGQAEPPRVAIVEPHALPPHVRTAISTALDELWLREYGRGQGQFFARMRPSVEETLEDETPPHLVTSEPLLRRMASVLEESSDRPQDIHEELTDLDEQVTETAELLAPFAGSSELVVGTSATFRDAAFEALATANEQVVLACPWVGQMGRDSSWQDAIRHAMARGIKVVLVWGIDGELLDDGETSWRALLALAREDDAGGLVFANRGASSHAKLIACDLSWAIATSCNYLNASPGRERREVGLRIRTVDRTVPLALQSVLGWARRRIPDHRAGDRCVGSPALFGLREARPDVLVESEQVLPPNTLWGAIGINTWRDGWRKRLDYLRALVGSSGSVVVPVLDGEHRDLLVRSIEQARRRLLIESHRASGYGLTEPVVEALRDALDRGVQVVLRHGTDEAPEAGTQERLDALQAVGARVVALDTHAKVLVHDDWAVVSSFNFLSADPGRRGAHELGLRTNDVTVANALWSAAASEPDDTAVPPRPRNR